MADGNLQAAVNASGTDVFYRDVFYAVHEKVTVPSEGGVSNDPHDNGGLTAYGVSHAFLKSLGADKPHLLRSLGLTLPVTEKTVLEVSPETAARIFYSEFWLAPGLYRLIPPFASACYDIGVNMGSRQGVKLLQVALNEKTCAGLRADGIIGPATCGAQAGLSDRAALSVHEELIRLHRLRYENIAARNPSQKRFLKGWLRRSSRLDSFIRERYFNYPK